MKEEVMTITPLDDIVELTDGTNIWHIKSEDLKTAIEYKLCQGCRYYFDCSVENNYCDSEESSKYETATIVNSDPIYIPIPHSECVDVNNLD